MQVSSKIKYSKYGKKQGISEQTKGEKNYIQNIFTNSNRKRFKETYSTTGSNNNCNLTGTNNISFHHRKSNETKSRNNDGWSVIEKEHPWEKLKVILHILNY